MKNLIARNGVATIFIGVLFASIAFFSVMNVLPLFAGIQTSNASVTPNTYRAYDFFAASSTPTVSATTTSATSTNILSWTNSAGQIDNGAFVIAGAKKVTLYFSRGDLTGQGNTGTTTFKVQTAKNADAVTAGTWEDLTQVVSSTSTTIANTAVFTAGVNSSIRTEASTSTLIFGMDLDYNTFFAIRCIVVETIDGEHSCKAVAQF